MHIFDRKVVDLISFKMYLANALINLRKELQTFYKIDLQLEY